MSEFGMAPSYLWESIVFHLFSHSFSCVVYYDNYIIFLLSQFGGFSAESLAERILDSTCRVLVTAGMYVNSRLDPGAMYV